MWIGNHKLIETGGDSGTDRVASRLELYDFQQDPTEALNLSDILPENVELLQECLQQFVGEYAGEGVEYGDRATEQHRAPGFDDPEVQRRLRDLGYLED